MQFDQLVLLTHAEIGTLRRQRIRLAIGLCVLLVGWIIFPDYCINAETLKQVRVGMSEDQVEDLFGGPAHGHGLTCFCGLGGCIPGVTAEWVGDHRVVVVDFVDDRAVQIKSRAPRNLSSGPGPSPGRWLWWICRRLVP